MKTWNITPIIVISILVGITLMTSCRNTNAIDTQNSPSLIEQTTSVTETPASNQASVSTEMTSPTISTDTKNTNENTTNSDLTNIIIDHTNWDWYNNQSSDVFENILRLKIFFAHASIGNNMIDGIKALHDFDAAKYPLIAVKEDGTPPEKTIDGYLYEYYRGNPCWTEKLNIYKTYTVNGWRYPAINISMNKLCAIDEEAIWETYLDSMLAIEAAYPDTIFVYFTIPYFTNTRDSYSNTLSNIFNNKLRSWIARQNNKVLFDIADIEAWSPTGVHQTFADNGIIYETLYDGFTDDGIHLNASASQRVATGLYSLFGKIISR